MALSQKGSSVHGVLFLFHGTLLKTTNPTRHPRQSHNRSPLKLLARSRVPVIAGHLTRYGCLPVATMTVEILP